MKKPFQDFPVLGETRRKSFSIASTAGQDHDNLLKLLHDQLCIHVKTILKVGPLTLAITQWRFPFWIFIINDWNLINIGIGSDIFNAKWRQMIKIKWEHFAKVSLPSLKIQMIRAPGIQLLPVSHDSRILSDLVLAMQVADGLVLPHKTFWISAIF